MLVGRKQAAEHKKTRQVIVEFDKALEELRESARRLEVAADNYRERLEGNRDR
jgi:predicted  nucleic acid-binding Zn-ribbon protein